MGEDYTVRKNSSSRCQSHFGGAHTGKAVTHTKQNGLGKLRRLYAPATTKLHNNTKTIAPITRGFVHLRSQKLSRHFRFD
jgi:hypothetical protein